MKLTVKTPWFKPARSYRGLRPSTWQGALVSFAFFVVLFLDVAYVYLVLVKIVIGLLAILTFGFIVYKTGDLANNNVF